jgi:tetratricopeptide (TPR) repeat protein
VERLGIPSHVTKLLRFVVSAKPQTLKGSIHSFGPKLRFQLVFDSSGSKHKDSLPRRCWCAELDAGKTDEMPNAVTDLAHGVLLDLGRVRSFRSSRGFRHFTEALEHHMEFYRLGRPIDLEKAVESYSKAIDSEGGSPEASCNLADLLYSQLTADANEKAIEAYEAVLQTNDATLRARALCGLANAYCQQRQRHQQGGDFALIDALRCAQLANDLCNEGLSKKNQAFVKKSWAYANQVYAELGHHQPDERRRLLDVAAELYRAAVELNAQFTPALNNLCYLFLESAKERISALRPDEAEPLLDKADAWCLKAIESRPTFHLPYDNRGNIFAYKARTKNGHSGELWANAITAYHNALSYKPQYAEAHNDLACAHAAMFRFADAAAGSGPLSGACSSHVHGTLAWRHHLQAHKLTTSEGVRGKFCREFHATAAEFSLPAFSLESIAECCGVEWKYCSCTKGE